MSKWIEVAQEMPPIHNRSVLIWCPENRNQYIAIYSANQWVHFGGFQHVTERVSHWKALGKGPDEEFVDAIEQLTMSLAWSEDYTDEYKRRVLIRSLNFYTGGLKLPNLTPEVKR